MTRAARCFKVWCFLLLKLLQVAVILHYQRARYAADPKHPWYLAALFDTVCGMPNRQKKKEDEEGHLVPAIAAGGDHWKLGLDELGELHTTYCRKRAPGRRQCYKTAYPIPSAPYEIRRATPNTRPSKGTLDAIKAEAQEEFEAVRDDIEGGKLVPTVSAGDMLATIEAAREAARRESVTAAAAGREGSRGATPRGAGDGESGGASCPLVVD